MNRADRSGLAQALSPWGSDLAFLAAGEYHENYVFCPHSGVFGPETPARAVLRLNHGSQLGLADQLAYKQGVLQAAAPSGRTPQPRALLSPAPAWPRGALVMDWLPGGPLDYRRDGLAAARTLARIHARARPAQSSRPLLNQAQPLAEVVAECRRLWAATEPWPSRACERDLRTAAAALETRALPPAPLTLVNTEVNAGNWLIHGSEAFLVDWEKAVLSDPVEDLAHFLSPTTTLWRRDFVAEDPYRRDFLAAYRLASDQEGWSPGPNLEERLVLMEQAVRLRALSWVCLVWGQYRQGRKALRDPVTEARLDLYLQSWADLRPRMSPDPGRRGNPARGNPRSAPISPGPPRPVHLLAVVPVWQEASRLAETLSALKQALGPETPLIVADAQSPDGSAGVAQAAGARVLQAPKGRGRQLAAGADAALAIARAQAWPEAETVLVFVHADTRLPPEARALLTQAYARARTQACLFRARFDRPHPLLALYAWFTRGENLWVSFGDQVLSCRANAYRAAGGFPLWSNFEDVALLQALRRRGPIRRLAAWVTTSARLFETEGFLRQQIRNAWFLLRYLAGADPQRFYGAYYRKLHSRAKL